MVKSSTISSFKAWWTPAAGLALVLVLLAEFVLAPLTPPERIFAFDQNNYERPGRQDYEALRVLLTFPQKPADIAIMGSSRPRDGILAPLLAAQLKLNLGRSVDVVNYAAVGFRAFDFEVLAQRLIAEPRVTPKVVVLPINPRFLQEEAERDNLRFSLMGFDQVGHELKTHGLSAPLHLVETILSNGVANLYALRLAAREWVEGTLPADFKPLESNPIFGGRVKLQIQDADWLRANKVLTSLENTPVKDEQLAEYVKVEWPAGVRHLGEAETSAFVRTLRRLRAADVHVILMDLPMSDVLRAAIPQEGLQAYRAFLQETAAQGNISYIAMGQFPPFLDRDFREQSHLNRSGATKLTQFVSVVLTQYLEGRDP